nr:antirestriction protein [Escherichia coli]
MSCPSCSATEGVVRNGKSTFGLIPQWVTLEPRIFGWMDRLCEDYCGGIWNLYTLNNGGAFMAPEPDDDDDENWVLFNAMNGNRAEMSPEAAGIAACLMTYSHHACRTECYAMTVHYYRLRDYALQHPECSAIMRIIDSHHACRTECYAMTVHYYRLRDYALQHPECSAIMRIID